MQPKFRRLANGILYRVVTVEDQIRATQAENERKAAAYARSAEGRKATRRVEEIDMWSAEGDKLNRLIASEMCSTPNFDIIENRAVIRTINGVRVAARSILVMYIASPEDDIGVTESVEDTVRFIVYRDADKPGTLRVSYGL